MNINTITAHDKQNLNNFKKVKKRFDFCLDTLGFSLDQAKNDINLVQNPHIIRNVARLNFNPNLSETQHAIIVMLYRPGSQKHQDTYLKKDRE